MATISLAKSAKVVVGDLDTSIASLGSILGLQSGTLVNSGISFFGLAPSSVVAQAAVNIGVPASIPGIGALPLSLSVDGTSKFIGNTTTIGTSQFFGASIAEALHLTNGVKVNTGAHVSTANKVITGNLTVTGRVIAVSYNGFIGACTGKKDFDIPHPTKSGWRLRHVCIEGPTADVYVRGTLDNKNVIELPEYWVKLVDAETITVNLTPIGAHQELFVDKIEWGTRIYIKNSSGAAIKCYYTVYGERKDTSKNIPEYEGTYDDYPGNNDEYILGAIRK